MKKNGFKYGILLLVLLMAAVAFAVSAGAASYSTVVFLKGGGVGDGSSPEQACGTYTDASEALDLS